LVNLLFSSEALLMASARNCYSENKESDRIVHRTFSGLCREWYTSLSQLLLMLWDRRLSQLNLLSCTYTLIPVRNMHC